jgi:hypothetical protein
MVDTKHNLKNKKKFTAWRGAASLPFSPHVKARHRADNSLELGFKLRAEAEAQNDFASLVDADLLILSGELETGNHVVFENLSDRQGRRFEAPLQLVPLPTRLDMGYQRKTAYANHKRIVEQFERPDIIKAIEEKALFPYFITPTYPNLVGRNLAENFEFIEEVARRFRDEEYYKKTLVAAFRKTEFTNGCARERAENHIAFDYREHGYNFHNHYLCLSSVELADTSSDCPKNCSGAKCGGVHCANHDHPKNKKLARIYTRIAKQVHLEMFGSRLRLETKSGLCVLDVRPIDLTDKGKGIFYEASKYLSKQSEFTELEPSELLSANRIFRNKKLVTSTGLFNRKQGRRKLNRASKLDALPLDKQPTSIFSFDSLLSTVESASSMLKIDREKSLKPPSLKEIGIELCRNGKRAEWLQLAPIEFKKQIERAKRKFLSRFPNAIIKDLDGTARAEYRRYQTDDERKRFYRVKARHQLSFL